MTLRDILRKDDTVRLFDGSTGWVNGVGVNSCGYEIAGVFFEDCQCSVPVMLTAITEAYRGDVQVWPVASVQLGLWERGA